MTAIVKASPIGSLEKAKTVQEVKAYVDVAKALRDVAKKTRGKLEQQNFYAKEHLLGQRKGGAMLAGAEKNRGTLFRGNTMQPRGKETGRLVDAGISKMESHRWQAIARIPEPVFTKHIDQQLELGKELTTVGVLKLASAIKPRSNTTKPLGTDGSFVTNLTELPAGEFQCIYADPPWKYSNQGTRASTDKHYVTMSVDDLRRLPIKELAAENCHLHLWTTNAFLFEAPKIFAAWGFEFKSSFVWVKPQMGIGNYWRCSHEFLLLGVRGRLTAQNKGLMSWASLKRKAHSQKPDEVRSMIEKLSPGPYLELFGRKPVPGWTVFGNEILK